MEEENEPLTTKVYYYIGTDKTPYVTEIIVPPSKIALIDFKDTLNKKQFKFFQKVHDPITKMDVREEILDEYAPLKKTSDGQFELYLLKHVDQNTLTHAKESRGSFSNFAGRLDSIARSQRRHILSTPALYGHYDESSMDDTNFYPDSNMMKDSIITENESQITDSEFTSVSQQYYKKHRHHQRRHKRRRPLRNMSFTTDSTLTDISLSLDLITVSFHLNSPVPLGLYVRGERNSGGDDVGLYISRIMPETLVAIDGRIREGYMIVEVNDISLDTYSNDQAVDILRDETKRSSILKLTVVQCDHEPGPSLRLPNEPVRPIDTNMWVMHTNMAQNLKPIPEGIENPSPTVKRTWPSSGIGSSVGSSTLGSVFTPRAFNLNTDLKTIVTAMADSAHGIQGKFYMHDSSLGFKGDDLISWLKTNVNGLENVERCNEYASQLLQKGLIIKKIDNNSFTQECYYSFGNGITNCIEPIKSTTHSQYGALKVIQNPHSSGLYSPVQHHHCKKSCTLKKIFCIHPDCGSEKISKSNTENKHLNANVRSTHIP